MTMAINLGASLIERGRKVLLVDIDPQSALSAGLGSYPLSLKETIYDVLRTPRFDLKRLILTTVSGCDLIPANIDLAASEIGLVSQPRRHEHEPLEPLTLMASEIFAETFSPAPSSSVIHLWNPRPCRDEPD